MTPHVGCGFQCVERSTAGHPAVEQPACGAFGRRFGGCAAPSSRDTNQGVPNGKQPGFFTCFKHFKYWV